mgnify:CR=1 FL=1
MQNKTAALIALLGIALTAILMLAMGAAGWWTLSSQRESLDAVRHEQIRSATGVLAQSAESMLAGNELSAVRRLTIDAKLQYGLSECRIILPDGPLGMASSLIARTESTDISAITAAMLALD